MEAAAIAVGFIAILLGYGFLSGFIPDAVYSNWLLEEIANGTLFIIGGAALVVVGVFGSRERKE